jgi:hypothetical protein
MAPPAAAAGAGGKVSLAQGPTLEQIREELERRGVTLNGGETLAKRAARSIEAAEEAELLRELAVHNDGPGNNPWGAVTNRKLAEIEEREAAELAVLPGPVVRGPGGEVALLEPLGHDAAGQYFKDTLQEPGTVAAAASRARMKQASDHGVVGESLAQALDAAETVGARDSIERMAAHQLAVCHGIVMDLFRDGAQMIRDRGKGQIRNGSPFDAMEFYNAEGCRLLNTAVRMMGAFQNGHATLARIRQGGRQTVTVQHVQVNDGGQAVVTGTVAAGGGNRGEGDRS